MSAPKIRCRTCKGVGHVKAPNWMSDSHRKLKTIEPATAAQFARKSGLELSNAHHRLARLVKAELATVDGKYPAKYRTR